MKHCHRLLGQLVVFSTTSQLTKKARLQTHLWAHLVCQQQGRVQTFFCFERLRNDELNVRAKVIVDFFSSILLFSIYPVSWPLTKNCDNAVCVACPPLPPVALTSGQIFLTPCLLICLKLQWNRGVPLLTFFLLVIFWEDYFCSSANYRVSPWVGWIKIFFERVTTIQ